MTRFLLALSVSILASVRFAATAPIESYAVGNWAVRTNIDSKTGQFSACIASAHYNSGIDLHVVVSRQYLWNLGFASPNWNFVPGAKATVEYRFDRSPYWTAAVVDVVNAKLVSMVMPANGPIVDLFRRSRIMEVRYGQQSFFFSLDSTSRLMLSLVDCVQRHLGYSAPGLAQAPAPDAGTGVAELKLEGTRVLSNFLIAAGIQNAALVSEAQFPKELSFAHAVAIAQDAVGFAIVLPSPAGTPDGVAAQIAGSVSERCDGKSGSGATKEVRNGAKLINAFTACQTNEMNVLLQYVVVSRQPAGQYVIGVLTENSDLASGNVSDPPVTSERIVNAAFQMSF